MKKSIVVCVALVSLCLTFFASADDKVVYSEAWLKADAAEKAARKPEPELVLPDRTKRLPYRVMWPNGRDSILAVREFYKDGSHTDWYLPNGRGRHYNSEGVFVSHIKGACAPCRGGSCNLITSSNSYKICPK